MIRYQRGGQPLLVSQEGAPQSTDIPTCVCGAKRQFEFQVLYSVERYDVFYTVTLFQPPFHSTCMQVMPQLLYYLKLDAVSEASIDWGTVIIYSCSASCTTQHGATSMYSTDLVWKQDFSTPKS